MKLATCSYCSSRTLLKLTARNGHELACGSCGAPLHEMKAVPLNREQKTLKRNPRRESYSERPLRYRKRKKPRKSIWERGFEEVIDVIEDIFD